MGTSLPEGSIRIVGSNENICFHLDIQEFPPLIGSICMSKYGPYPLALLAFCADTILVQGPTRVRDQYGQVHDIYQATEYRIILN
jgi:hypothetical protein